MTTSIDGSATKTDARREAGHLVRRIPFSVRPRESGGPVVGQRWIPAFAGMSGRREALLLLRRGRSSARRSRRRRRRDRIVLLDLGVGAQLGDHLGLRLARHVLL